MNQEQLDRIHNRQQWERNFYFGVLVGEVQGLIYSARITLGFYPIDHLDRLETMDHAIWWYNDYTAKNLRYQYECSRRRARQTRSASRTFYRALARLHQERVNILVQLLQNDCVELHLKFEIITNLPRLLSMKIWITITRSHADVL